VAYGLNTNLNPISKKGMGFFVSMAGSLPRPERERGRVRVMRFQWVKETVTLFLEQTVERLKPKCP